MNDEKALEIAHRAEAELALTREAFDLIRQRALDRLVATSLDQRDFREKLYIVAQTADQVKKALIDMVAGGQIAEVALAKQGLTRP